MKEDFENADLSNIINELSKKEEGFIDLAYEVANNHMGYVSSPEEVENFITELYSLLHELYNAPERSAEEKETISGAIGFLEEVTIHVGPFFDDDNQIEGENNYLSGYSNSSNFRETCVENGKKIVNGEKPLFAIGEYFDNDDKIDEYHYYSIIEKGKDAPLEVSEIPSQEEFLEKRDGKSSSISEIEDVISTRKPKNLNTVVSEIEEIVNPQEKENHPINK